MNKITMTVNGRAISAEVEARTSLADFLREHCHLTGTHLGCEHGVCGACTIELDGNTVRSCITLAVVCDGAQVRSIEGFNHDPAMKVVQQAFHEAHGLQCGFCTPGMLISARDFLLRKRGLDEKQIRVELSGNLCRCTGYAGIVRACQIAGPKLDAMQEEPVATGNQHGN